MERRFEVRKQEMMRECKVSEDVFANVVERLMDFAQPFVQCLYRAEQKDHAQVYLSGLMSDLKRKNVESIAYRFDRERQGMQRFIGSSTWDHKPLVHELARQVGAELGEPDAVIVFDPSGFKKKGRDSVGVARQWLGRHGKVDNGQVAVYMAYAARQEHALVDTRLYLTEEWAKDKARRKACGVPKTVRFQTRHALALEMLADLGSLLPHAWVAGDDEMGRPSAFRQELASLGERYLLAVPSNTGVRDLEAKPPPYGGRGRIPQPPFQPVSQWRAALPETAWTRVNVRDGEKGPLTVEVAITRVLARTERRRRGPVREEVLVVTRTLDEDKKVKHDYYLSNAPAGTPLEEFARVAKAEHRVEESLERGKSEVGLGDYEVRTWSGWYHHQVLCLIAIWFLVLETKRAKKKDAGPHSAPSPDGTRTHPSRRLWLREPSTHRGRKNPAAPTQRRSPILSLEST